MYSNDSDIGGCRIADCPVIVLHRVAERVAAKVIGIWRVTDRAVAIVGDRAVRRLHNHQRAVVNRTVDVGVIAGQVDRDRVVFAGSGSVVVGYRRIVDVVDCDCRTRR